MLFEGIGPFICLKENAETAMNAVIQDVENKLEDVQTDVLNHANTIKKLVRFFYPISTKNSDKKNDFQDYLYWKYTPPSVQQKDGHEPKHYYQGLLWLVLSLVFAGFTWCSYTYIADYVDNDGFIHLTNDDGTDKWMFLLVSGLLAWAVTWSISKAIEASGVFNEKVSKRRKLNNLLKSLDQNVDETLDIDRALFNFKGAILNFNAYLQRIEDNLNAARQCRDYAKENHLHLHNFKVPRYPFMQTSGEDIYPHKIFRQLNDNPQLVEQDLVTILTTLHPLCLPADSISNQGYEAEESIETKPSQTKHEATLWVMKPNGEVGGPFTKQYLKELKDSGKLPPGLKASRLKDGPWQNLQSG